MGWKPKEKPLTPEEAVALAKKELTPQWHGMGPMLAAVRHGDAVSVHPLDTTFAEKSWLMAFVDPSDYSSYSVYPCFREFSRRYERHGITPLLILEAPYPELCGEEAIKQLTRQWQFHCAIVHDREGLLAQAFKVNPLPGFFLFGHGKPVSARFGDKAGQIEADLQKFLRTTDPGLALFPAFHPPAGATKDVSRLEFGSAPQRRGVVQFPKPGFHAPIQGFMSGAFTLATDGPFSLGGNWLQDGDRIATSDPRAKLFFRAPSTEVMLVAQSLAKGHGETELVIEIDNGAVPESVAAEGLEHNDEGQTVLRVDQCRAYPLLRKLSRERREVTLSFPGAAEQAVALYGLRFGE